MFSTSCEFCKVTLPAWKRIAGTFAGNSQVKVVGISVDGVQVSREYVDEHGLEFPVVSFTDRKLRALYRAGITPQTLIVDAEGKVSFARIGAVTETGAVDSIIEAVPVSIHKPSNGSLNCIVVWDQSPGCSQESTNSARRQQCSQR